VIIETYILLQTKPSTVALCSSASGTILLKIMIFRKAVLFLGRSGVPAPSIR
jgi:hypothetical protein